MEYKLYQTKLFTDVCIHVTGILKIKIETGSLGNQYLSEVNENSRIVTVMSVTSPPAKTPSSGNMGC